VAKVQVPSKNSVFYNVTREFSPEGFCNLNVLDAFNEIGYSRAETRRLLNDGAIKVWDTRVNGNKMEWYKRRSREMELVEPDEVFIFGKPKVLTIRKKPFVFYKRLFYWLRPYCERVYECLLKK